MPGRLACRRVVIELPAYAADRLPAAARSRIERHLETCAACRGEAEAYRRALGLMVSAGQAPLPASRVNWQMLADRMETYRAPCIGSRAAAASHYGLALSLAGAIAIAFVVGRAFHAVQSRKPDHTAQRVSPWPIPQKEAIAEQPPAAQTKERDAGPPFVLAHRRVRITHDLHLKTQMVMTPKRRMPHTDEPAPTTKEVRRLLALAARKIDAIERNPSSQQRDIARFLVALRSAREAQAAQELSTLAITVQAADRTLLDSRDAFTPQKRQGGASWMRQTLLEQPDGDRTTETVAFTFQPDHSQSYFNLQICTPVDRHSLGDPQP